jgi:hypothetical protein
MAMMSRADVPATLAEIALHARANPSHGAAHVLDAIPSLCPYCEICPIATRAHTPAANRMISFA